MPAGFGCSRGLNALILAHVHGMEGYCLVTAVKISGVDHLGTGTVGAIIRAQNSTRETWVLSCGHDRGCDAFE